MLNCTLEKKMERDTAYQLRITRQEVFMGQPLYGFMLMFTIW